MKIISSLRPVVFSLLIFSFVIAPHSLYAQTSIDDKTKELCNKVMKAIFDDIMQQKEKYVELRDLTDAALSKNTQGIYKIVYEHKLTDDSQPVWKRTPYAFALTIEGMEDQTFPPQEGSFNYGFPVLGIKFSGYQKRHQLRTQFDVLPLLGKYGGPLAEYEQNFLPLRLTLKTTQDTYKVRDDIEFEVILQNVSNRHMIVKDLGQDTLYFILNNESWGTRPYSNQTGGKDVVLKSGEKVVLKFKGESFQKPQDVNIYAVYRMSIKGVNPSGILKIKIVE